ncbi:hypothetical protein [Stenotrophomonas maltophilia]|uniref:hypothetical protein n=1 Tax=Stenotrophomonas maltophilia TaxID=40324 RepID=UPI0021C95596|nr:hypothetical protein [Stenotrophomonas maltophilia]MCU1068857.1 hypothetical protein [Stenotrophomonas maltophilia]MCU1075188.1 hypothetical protein [Stenotrophomonas maltophilia]MCU1140966.1 hypothetical protein [Stenotrophomonas maltophilia]
MTGSIPSFALAVGLLVLSGPVASDNAQPRDATYASVCRHTDSGDLLGLEVSFISEADGGYALVQRYEGAAIAPVLMQVKQRERDLVLVSGATDSIALRQDGKTLRLTYLDGQLSAAGSSSENLIPSLAVWQGKSVAACH